MTTPRSLHTCVPAGLSRAFAAAAWIGGVLFAPVVAEANSFTIRLGYLAPRGDSRLWSENVATFDRAVDDFNWIFGGAELDIELSEYFDLALGVDGYSRSISSHYRDFVRDDGTEVFHEAGLRVVPITFGGRLLPIGKFHALRPYVAGGFGLYPFEYWEHGEFIDFATAEIFGASYVDQGVGAGAYAAAGLEASLSRSISVMGEYRRHFVSAGHGGDFGAYGDFDLDAGQLGFGFAFRF
jgi:hypothetical protein